MKLHFLFLFLALCQLTEGNIIINKFDWTNIEIPVEINNKIEEMAKKDSQLMVPDEVIMNKIYLIRGKKVMLDRDLATLYEVETKQLKRAVRRNITRFPEDFMLELTTKEFSDLRSQFGTSSWGGTRYLPLAFTEHDNQILVIFEYLKQLEEVKQQELEQKNRKTIGYKRKGKQ